MLEKVDHVEVSPKNWDSDPVGRIRNLSLAPNSKNSLVPLFEAVMNSIHAIEERFGKDNIERGVIDIQMLEGDEGEYTGFEIQDNGIGFTEDNLASFRRMDSRRKAEIGGKGVGRLLWLKVADSISIESVYGDGSTKTRTNFILTEDNPVKGLVSEVVTNGRVGTRITVDPYYSAYATSIPKKLTTIANRVIAHFISYFVNMKHPTIRVSDSRTNEDLFDKFSDEVVRDCTYDFKFEGRSENFRFHCFLLPKIISDDESSTNAMYLGAHGRAVNRYDLDSVIGMKAIAGKYAFLGYVESTLLDESANDTRTSFSLDHDFLNEIVDQAKAFRRTFLVKEISEIRERQATLVDKVRREHPRFLSIARNAADFVEKLHLSTQGEEEIYVELSRHTLRTHNRNRRTFQDGDLRKPIAGANFVTR